MAKRFFISGSIVDVDADKTTLEDVTPTQLNSFVKGLSKDDELEIDITSYGGSVTAGLAMVNILRQLQRDGHKTTAHVIGIAASMASVIACACDNLVIDDNAFLMVHLPWTVTQGNAIDLRKQADVLDRYRDALVSIYRSKFDLGDDEIIRMLEAETWIIGSDCKSYNLNAEVIKTDEPMRIAACLNGREMPKFLNAPKTILEKLDMENKVKKAEEKKVEEETEKETVEEEKETEEVKEEEKTDDEEVTEEETEKKELEEEEKPVETEEVEEKEVTEETVEENETVEEEDGDEKKPNMVTKAECEKRVSGMQSTMAKQMDTMRKQYEAKISEFEIKAKAMCEELEKVKAESISLKSTLDKTEKELSETISAFEEKKNALDSLNANVNKPNLNANEKPWKNLHGEALLKWCRENQAR